MRKVKKPTITVYYEEPVTVTLDRALTEASVANLTVTHIALAYVEHREAQKNGFNRVRLIELDRPVKNYSIGIAYSEQLVQFEIEPKRTMHPAPQHQEFARWAEQFVQEAKERGEQPRVLVVPKPLFSYLKELHPFPFNRYLSWYYVDGTGSIGCWIAGGGVRIDCEKEGKRYPRGWASAETQAAISRRQASIRRRVDRKRRPRGEDSAGR